MRVVIAVGGNAIALDENAVCISSQRQQLRASCQKLAAVAQQNELILTHGNGPQVGDIAIRDSDNHDYHPYPLDVLCAETQGMLGYMLEQLLTEFVPGEQALATLLTMVRVAADDPALDQPSKPIGPKYSEQQYHHLKQKHNWSFTCVDGQWQRVVASPQPIDILQLKAIKKLLSKEVLLICGGGGGVPVIVEESGAIKGVEGIVDKDLTSALIAEKINADKLVILTDIDAVYRDWNTDDEQKIESITAKELRGFNFEKGSMGPKVQAACQFVERSGKSAAIGCLNDLSDILQHKAGTHVRP